MTEKLLRVKEFYRKVAIYEKFCIKVTKIVQKSKNLMKLGKKSLKVEEFDRKITKNNEIW